MSFTRTLPKDADAQVEWFHDLAERTSTSRSLDLNVREGLAQFLEAQVPGHPLSGAETEAELIAVIRDLRANESAWNRTLQGAMVRADDAFREGNELRAREELERFSRQCPWVYFSEIALDQANLYKPAQ